MRSVVTVIGLTFTTSVALGAKIGAGAIELATRGSFEHDSISLGGDSAGSSTTLDVATGLNYSVTDLLALGGSVNFYHASVDPDGEASISSGRFGGTVSLGFNFASQSAMIPFVDIGVGFVGWTGDGNENAETTIALPVATAGIRFLVADGASLNSFIGFSHVVNAFGVSDLDANAFFLGFGISFFPKGLAPRG